MAMTANCYANAFAQAFAGNVNWDSDSIKMILLGSGYTPNLSGHVHYSDVSSYEVSGTGYIAGGAALSSKTVTVTAANSWSTTWQASSAYTAGAIVRPTSGNGFLYQAVTSGTSSATQPTWPTTVGETVTDGSVTWVCSGESVTQFSSAAVTWTSSTITASYAVIIDAQSGSASTDPLVALVSFGSSQSSAAGSFTVTPGSLGWFVVGPA